MVPTIHFTLNEPKRPDDRVTISRGKNLIIFGGRDGFQKVIQPPSQIFFGAGLDLNHKES
jgi:hypothetical protein